MNITEITAKAGAHRRRKRIGRGEGSGHGRTSGRGNKGGGQRAGWTQRLFFEGGAFPLFRRVAKRGFNNFNFATEYQIVNVGRLAELFPSGGHVTAAVLAEMGAIGDAKAPLKILGDGELKVKLTVEAERFSAEAAKKLEAAGGTIKRLGPQPKKKFVKPARVAKAPPAEGKKKEKGEGGKKGDKGDKAAKGEKGQKGEKGEKPPKAEKPHKAEASAPAEKPASADDASPKPEGQAG